MYEDSQMSPEGGIAHFGFNITNFDEIISNCEKHGVEILYGGHVQFEKSRSVYIKDPNGYEIELSEVNGERVIEQNAIRCNNNLITRYVQVAYHN